MLLKIRHNKRTNQLDVSLSRRQFHLSKKKIPKFIEVKEVNFIE